MNETLIPAINCPKCGHNIDGHVFSSDLDRYKCGSEYSDCTCTCTPAFIARALLYLQRTAEPTDTEIDEAAEAVHGAIPGINRWTAGKAALAALRATRKKLS